MAALVEKAQKVAQARDSGDRSATLEGDADVAELGRQAGYAQPPRYIGHYVAGKQFTDAERRQHRLNGEVAIVEPRSWDGLTGPNG
jgi:hypothetical protein